MPDPLFTAEQLGALNAPLDRSRVKRRQGRGSTQFDYLEAHDVIRRANDIFGYGRWGHEIVVQERIGELEVTQSNDRGTRTGWHVAYRCIVRLTVAGCVPVSGSGFGDAVEYGPAARLTASELALKESESDALKRALKNYGDQFGLILYAKEPVVRSEPVRSESGGKSAVPRSWAKVKELVLASDTGDRDWGMFEAFVRAASYHQFGKSDSKQLTADQRKVMLQKAAGAAVWLVENADHGTFRYFDQDDQRKAWAFVLEGVQLEIPDYVEPEPTQAEKEAAELDADAERIAAEVFADPS